MEVSSSQPHFTEKHTRVLTVTPAIMGCRV